jgi:hypothetical protein
VNVSPKWEINFGVGVGPTTSTDHFITDDIARADRRTLADLSAPIGTLRIIVIEIN